MKRDWADGYVADITYSHGYFHELAPNYLRYYLLVNGHACPSDGGPYTYCELGYGQGVSANLHAATNPRGEFWGTDFNPDHALFARSVAQQVGVKAHWQDLSFEGFLDSATPQFDFIVMHGIWSWVSPAAQHALVEFIRRKLKPGGTVFISYNVLPGWNAEKPLRDLLWMHTEHASPPGASTPTRIANALAFARSLRRHGCAYLTENARASEALDDMLRQEPGSLAHEYFNQSWWLTYFADVDRALQAASLNFACSIHISDIAGEVRERLAGAGFLDASFGAPLRETVTDFVLNRRFRRDVFVRGSLRLSAVERMARLAEVKFVLARPAAEVTMTLTTPYGHIPLDEAKVKPLVEAIAAAPQAISLAQLRGVPEAADWSDEDLVLALSRLVARRDVCPVFADDAALVRESRASAFNALAAHRSCDDNSIRYLASPVAASGIDTSRSDRLFWLAWHEGSRTAAELARAVSGWYATADMEDLEQRAQRFIEAVVPVWRKLGMLDTRPVHKARK
jgi:SAM-dependent methyltransferase